MAFDIDDQATIDLAEALAAREGMPVEQLIKLALEQFAERDLSDAAWAD